MKDPARRAVPSHSANTAQQAGHSLREVFVVDKIENDVKKFYTEKSLQAPAAFLMDNCPCRIEKTNSVRGVV
jgi:hypothetical protein